MVGKLRAILFRLRRGGYEVGPNGVFKLPRELRDRAFMVRRAEVGAVVLWLAPGQRFAPDIQKLISVTARAYGQPEIIETETPDDVAEMWNADTARIRATASRTIPNYQRVLESIFTAAAEADASDVKIIEGSTSTQVRIVIAGQELDWPGSVTTVEGRRMISHIFSMRDGGSGTVALEMGTFAGFSIQASSEGIGNFRMPPRVLKIRGQKGFHEQADGSHGYHVVARILYRTVTDKQVTLSHLGHDSEVLGVMAAARKKMKGAVIIGGETGDGKSTSIVTNIHAMVEEKQARTSIMTIEDPVEYAVNLPGVIQIPVQAGKTSEEREANYRAALMHFVRCNPQVGMVSEIRDVYAARQVFQFIESGHQVWTTIHVTSADNILFRLIDMGVEPPELARPNAIQLLARQVLVPVLCPHCRKAHPHHSSWNTRNPDGCPTCLTGNDGKERQGVARDAWAGYQRLLAVTEIIKPNDAFLGFVQKNDAIGARKYWLGSKKDGGLAGLSVPEKLAAMVNAGLIDVTDALKKGGDPEERTISEEPEKLAWYRRVVENYDFDLGRLPDRPPADDENHVLQLASVRTQ